MAQNSVSVPAAPISFGERLAASATFDSLFRTGMDLVEETAAYLDGAGRAEANALPRLSALTYASESMRLTTRLMQIASWLLLQRAINEGEMTPAEAAADKSRTRTAWQTAPKQRLNDALPPTLIELSEKSLMLQARILRLDTMMSEPAGAPAAAVPSPLDDQMARLRQAFQG